jgi:hypothetical protein
VLPAFFLVVAGLGNGVDRTAVDAFAAGPFSVVKAVSMVVCIGSGCWGDGNFRNDRSGPHGFASGGDKSVTKTERAQTGGMSSMAFRPGRGIREPRRIDDRPVGNKHRSDCRVSRPDQTLYHVLPQCHIELLAVDPDSCPFLGRILPGPLVRFAHQFPLRQNPAMTVSSSAPTFSSGRC